jgi:hypothetical protein
MQTFRLGVGEIALRVKGQDILRFTNGVASNPTCRDNAFELEEDYNISHASGYTGIFR